MFPVDTEFYTWDGYEYKFYKSFIAFNMRCLYYCTERNLNWTVCGYHPWDDLIPIQELLLA